MPKKRKKAKDTRSKVCFLMGTELTRIVGQLNCAEQLTGAGDWGKATAALMTALSTAEALSAQEPKFKDLAEKVKGLRCDYFARITNPPDDTKPFTDRIGEAMTDAGTLIEAEGRRCGLA